MFSLVPGLWRWRRCGCWVWWTLIFGGLAKVGVDLYAGVLGGVDGDREAGSVELVDEVSQYGCRVVQYSIAVALKILL